MQDAKVAKERKSSQKKIQVSVLRFLRTFALFASGCSET
jgi:hypothetical protein